MNHTIADEDLITLDRFLAMPEPLGHRLEVSRGRVVQIPAPWAVDGRVAGRLAAALGDYDRTTRRGWGLLYSRYVLSESPATVRIPDVSFAPTRRIPREGYHNALWRLAPALAVQVLASQDRFGDVQARIDDYLEAGVRLIWIIELRTRSATVIRPGEHPIILEEDESLDGEDVLPGFTIPLERLFRGYCRRCDTHFEG